MGIKDWEADIWSYVQEDVDRFRKLNPLRLDDPGWLETLKFASANLASESGLTRAMPWNLAWVNPLVEAIPNDEVTFACALKTRRYLFTVDGKWQAPVSWPLERQIPLGVLHTQLAPDAPVQYGRNNVIRGFWIGFKESKDAWLAEKTEANQRRHQTFEDLVLNLVVDIKLFENKQAREAASFDLVESVEEERENNGFFGARKTLLALWGKDQVKRIRPGKTPTNQEIADYLASKITFFDPKQAPSAKVIESLLLNGMHVYKNRRCKSAIGEAEVMHGRDHPFDEYTKVRAMITKSRNKDDLGFIFEFIVLQMKLDPGVTMNQSRDSLTARAGVVAEAQAARDALAWLWKQGGEGWADMAWFLDVVQWPTGFGNKFPGDGSTAQEETTKVLKGAKGSLRIAMTFVRAILTRSSAWVQRVRGHLSNHMPLSAMPWDKIFPEVFEDERSGWKEFLEALANESGSRRADGAGDTAGRAGETAGSEKDEEMDQEKIKNDLQQEALDRAKNTLDTDPGLLVVGPSSWNTAVLTGILKSQIADATLGTCIGIFHPGADTDARVSQGFNTFKEEPPADVIRMRSFAESMDAIMKPCRDFCLFFEGRVPENHMKIAGVIEARRWKSRELTLVANKSEYDQRMTSARPVQSQRRKARKFRGIASASYKELVYICWKPEGRQQARARAGYRHYVDEGSRVADDVMNDVPVLAHDDLPRVDPHLKTLVLAGSAWEGKPESEAGSDESSKDESGDSPMKNLRAKRGRGLQRQCTDPAKVPLFHHPIHPQLVKELCHELQATWVVMGTPEAGVGLLGALGLKVPVVALARNDAHAEILKELVLHAIQAQVLTPTFGSDFANLSLAKRWKQCCGSHGSDSDSSSSDGEASDDGEGEQEDGKGAKDKKQKKEGKKKKHQEGKEKKEGKKKKKKRRDEKEKKKRQEEKEKTQEENKEKDSRKRPQKAEKEKKADSVLAALMNSATGTTPV